MRISALRMATMAIALVGFATDRHSFAQSSSIASGDLFRMRSVTELELSPDGKRIAYSVRYNDGPGRPYTQIWVLDVATKRSTRLTPEGTVGGDPKWSPDGRWIAYWDGGARGEAKKDPFEPVVTHELVSPGDASLTIARPDGTEATSLAAAKGTNHDLPRADTGSVAWSPDGKRIAFLSATPGPETEQASGDPRVITRYGYKPTAGEGRTRFNDNRRLHVFVVDVSTKEVRQLTTGNKYEHSIDWSPNGDEIAFISNPEPDPDRFFNYDIFTVRVSDGAVRRVAETETVEYSPRWSPDGKTIAFEGGRRGLGSSESFMEDTHVWLMDAEGGNRRELGRIDNRQGPPRWAPDGSAVYSTVQERGNVRLYRFPVSGGEPEAIVNDRGSVGSFSVAGPDLIAYAFHSPRDLAQLYVKTGGSSQRMTDLNAEVLAGKQIAEVEAFTFLGHDHEEVEAFLTKPATMKADGMHPLITMIKGGPHGQQGPAFHHTAQVYAAQGFAALMINYRGSTGYGQRFADAIFGKMGRNCGEPMDILFGVGAALRRNSWLDPESLGIEGGSCGGQLSGWIITQTPRFKAAIPAYGIYNLISFNYMSYYHDYMAVESGAFPHQENMMDSLWEWSSLKHVAKVKTPTMLVHGENDNDVPIAESEQFYIALSDVGVETTFVRYPREGHGIAEPKHIVDLIDRSIAWYRKHFTQSRPPSTPTPTDGAR